MSLHLSTVQIVIGAAVGIVTVASAIWKVALPLIRSIFKMKVVYAACIAELLEFGPGLRIETPLDKVVPIRRFPGYSDWSIQGPNLPPRADEDQKKLFAILDGLLTGEALKDAHEWERTCPPDLTLLTDMSSREARLYQTYLRMRWLLLQNGKPDYERVAQAISTRCAEALRAIEAETHELLSHFPTRVLIIRVKNRGSQDAKDLRIEVTTGGEIYDVVIDDRQPDEVQKTAVRLLAKYQVLQPAQAIELRLWYGWSAVSFGSRMFSQSESFPGREGALIRHLGFSNGRMTHLPRLLSDIEAWRKIDTDIGPERGFGRF